jgi:hypothetical protein
MVFISRYEPLELREILGVLVIFAIIGFIAIFVFLYEIWQTRKQQNVVDLYTTKAHNDGVISESLDVKQSNVNG